MLYNIPVIGANVNPVSELTFLNASLCASFISLPVKKPSLFKSNEFRLFLKVILVKTTKAKIDK